ncbi:MAG TPA: silent information regulator protein Sir2 [Planctomycetota bacterium]|jgi:rhamnogalacturonan endolyase
MRNFLVLLGAVALSAVCWAENLVIANADFESGKGESAENWKWWSRNGGGSAKWTSDDKHGGEHGVCIKHDDEKDWAYVNSTHFSVKAGQAYTVSAWIRPKTGRVELAVVALSKGKTINWTLAGAEVRNQDKWLKVDARAEIEEPCDEIYLRFVGMGPALAWVDDVAIAVAAPLPPPQPKPKVEGYAFGKERVREKLDRGVVAMPVGGGKVHVGWRLLDTDAAETGFNVYRRVASADGTGSQQLTEAARGTSGTRLNSEPIKETTDFMDAKAPAGACEYFVRAVVNGAEGEASAAAKVAETEKAQDFVRIPLQGNYRAQKVGIADLDGDGKLDYVIKQPFENIDPYEKYWSKSPDTYKLEAYNNDGKFMWRYDLGWAVERGIWYSPYVVFDLDGDGKAEVICKDGEGDPRDAEGKVQSGPEYLTILDGQTGKVRARTDWVPRALFEKFGYNYASRNQLGIAYLDGKTPCLIVERGTYNLIILVAYEFHDGKLRELWRWSNENLKKNYWGQGAHWMHAADVDGDGRDEVIIGSACIDDNGAELWTTGLGHPDHTYVGHLDPSRPGLQMYYGMETHHDRNGMGMVDAANGKILWGFKEPTVHIHSSGLVSDLDSSSPGAECYSGERDEKEKRWIWKSNGELHDGNCAKYMGGLAPRAAYWDADPQRELILGKKIVKYKGAELGQIEGEIIGVADVLGDWREEIITTMPGELRIYVSPIPATDRHVCLMRDPIYRIDVAHGAMGYLQVPTLSYDMATER